MKPHHLLAMMKKGCAYSCSSNSPTGATYIVPRPGWVLFKSTKITRLHRDLNEYGYRLSNNMTSCMGLKKIEHVKEEF